MKSPYHFLNMAKGSCLPPFDVELSTIGGNSRDSQIPFSYNLIPSWIFYMLVKILFSFWIWDVLENVNKWSRPLRNIFLLMGFSRELRDQQDELRPDLTMIYSANQTIILRGKWCVPIFIASSNPGPIRCDHHSNWPIFYYLFILKCENKLVSLPCKYYGLSSKIDLC